MSGTGSVGATIRIYFEKYEKDPSKFNLDTAEALKDIIKEGLEISEIKKYIGTDVPTVITWHWFLKLLLIFVVKK